jgi:hypothetical protein
LIVGCEYLLNHLHQYKQNEQPPLQIIEQDVDVWRSQSRSCIGTGTKKIRAYTDSAIVLSMFILSFVLWQCLIFWSEMITCRFFFIVCLYLYCLWTSNYQDGRVGIPLTGLIPSYFTYIYPKPGFGFNFQRHMLWYF